MESPDKNQNEFVEQMMKIGMSENESKAYYAVFMLKSATVRDVYEISGVPRNKIYHVLASLEERGFVSQTKSRPIRYAAEEIKIVFDRLRDEVIRQYDTAETYLCSLFSRETIDIRPRIHELQSEWAIENHIKLLLRRTKHELIILVGDAEYVKNQVSDASLRRLSKKLEFYPILMKPESAAEFTVPCYRFRKEDSKIFGEEGKLHPFITQDTILLLIADRQNILNISRVDGRLFALMLYLDDSYSMVSYLFEPMVKSLVLIPPHL